ncbi:MAG: archaeosine biosynthesis radical SAM protein RaSEA [Promethearchaeota archaeon]
MKVININYNGELIEKIKLIRSKSLKRKKKYSKEQLNKPINFWIKPDRLLNQIGKEFVVILRTKGCSMTLEDSGGCSMCGYIQDANLEKVKPIYIMNQFDYALKNKLEEIEKDNNNYVIKLFNSGSFFDNNEIAESVRTYIYKKIADIKNIKEVVVESRVEYVKPEDLIKMRELLNKKYVEIGIGIETVNDYIRNNYINKGLIFDDFLNTFQTCKEHGIGIKAYLLFKPPFVNEESAIDDCIDSIKSLIKLNINSISINPLNIQKGTLVEYLWYQNRYRPPWFYSLIKCLKKSITQKNLKNVRILSDPSGAGTKRGIHNCLKRECNENYIKILKNFVLKQDLNQLRQTKFDFDCECKLKYRLQRKYC